MILGKKSYKSLFKIDVMCKMLFSFHFLQILYLLCYTQRDGGQSVVREEVHWTDADWTALKGRCEMLLMLVQFIIYSHSF